MDLVPQAMKLRYLFFTTLLFCACFTADATDISLTNKDSERSSSQAFKSDKSRDSVLLEMGSLEENQYESQEPSRQLGAQCDPRKGKCSDSTNQVRIDVPTHRSPYEEVVEGGFQPNVQDQNGARTCHEMLRDWLNKENDIQTTVKDGIQYLNQNLMEKKEDIQKFMEKIDLKTLNPKDITVEKFGNIAEKLKTMSLKPGEIKQEFINIKKEFEGLIKLANGEPNELPIVPKAIMKLLGIGNVIDTIANNIKNKIVGSEALQQVKECYNKFAERGNLGGASMQEELLNDVIEVLEKSKFMKNMKTFVDRYKPNPKGRRLMIAVGASAVSLVTGLLYALVLWLATEAVQVVVCYTVPPLCLVTKLAKWIFGFFYGVRKPM